MEKVNSLSLCKRFMSLVASVMLMFSSLPGLAEDSEVEIITDAKVEEEDFQLTEEMFLNAIALAKEKNGPIFKGDDFNIREYGSAYFVLGGFKHCNVEVIRELIEKNIIINEEGLLLENIKKNLMLYSAFDHNSKAKKENDMIDFSLLFCNKKNFEFFQSITKGLNDFLKKYNKGKKINSDNLNDFRDFISTFNEACSNVSMDNPEEICILYVINDIAWNEMVDVIGRCVPLEKMAEYIDTDKSYFESLVPLKGVTFDCDSSDENMVLLSGLDILNKTSVDLSAKISVYDAMLSEGLKVNTEENSSVLASGH